MSKQNQETEHVSDGVNLLISILVRYPEIGSIKFSPQTKSLRLTFMVSPIPNNEEFDVIRKTVLESIQAYMMLEGYRETIADVQLSTYEQVAMLSIVRDLNTLSKGEIALMISLLRDNFRDRLVTDSNNSILEEDLLIQEELIDNMLQNIKYQKNPTSLTGIREDGRVLVFNK